MLLILPFFSYLSIFRSPSLCSVSSTSTNWVLPPSESSNLSVHGISVVQMAGSSQCGTHSFYIHFGQVSLFIAITSMVSQSRWPSFNPVSHCLMQSLRLALTSLTSCPPFLSHINSKIALNFFWLPLSLSSRFYSHCYLLLLPIPNFHLMLCMLLLLLLRPCPPHLVAFSLSSSSFVFEHAISSFSSHSPLSFSHFLFPVSYLKFLQALLDVDLASTVVCVRTGPGLVGPRPLGVEEGALYPLGSRGAQYLSTALSGLLLQVVAHWGGLSICVCVPACVCVMLHARTCIVWKGNCEGDFERYKSLEIQ